MNSKGFAPLIIPIAVMLIMLLGGGAVYVNHQTNDKKPKPTPTASIEPSTSPHASESASINPSPKVSAKPTVKASSTPIKTPSPTSTPKPITSATPSTGTSTSSTPTPTAKPKVTCEVNFLPGTSTAPAEIKLIYGAYFWYKNENGDNYVTNVQWDWDGDGTWDTDMSYESQHVTHIYDKPGTYTAKMHLQTSMGDSTDTCSKTITIN